MRIAVCDDEITVLRQVESRGGRYFIKKKNNVKG